MSAAIRHSVTIAGLPYTLVFKFGTIRMFEQALGRTLAEAMPKIEGVTTEAEAEAAVGKIPLDVWSALFWAVLQPGHRITQEGTDDLIDAAGLATVIGWLLRGIAAYNAGDPALLEIDFGDEEAAGNAQAGKPRKARPAS